MIPLAGAVGGGANPTRMGYTVTDGRPGMRCSGGWLTWRYSVLACRSFVGRCAGQFSASASFFAFGLSMRFGAAVFHIAGKVYWLFESGYEGDVLGPFVNRDHYAALSAGFPDRAV